MGKGSTERRLSPVFAEAVMHPPGAARRRCSEDARRRAGLPGMSTAVVRVSSAPGCAGNSLLQSRVGRGCSATRKDWVLEQILLAVGEEKFGEREKGTGRGEEVPWCWGKPQERLAADLDVRWGEVGPGNIPCPLWGGSFILWALEGGKSLEHCPLRVLQGTSSTSETWLGCVCVSSPPPLPSQSDGTGCQTLSNEAAGPCWALDAGIQVLPKIQWVLGAPRWAGSLFQLPEKPRTWQRLPSPRHPHCPNRAAQHCW